MDAFHVLNAGCGGIIDRALLSPTGCEAEPTHAGLWFASHGRTVWLGFACDRHADQLIAARPLLPRDRAEPRMATVDDRRSVTSDRAYCE